MSYGWIFPHPLCRTSSYHHHHPVSLLCAQTVKIFIYLPPYQFSDLYQQMDCPSAFICLSSLSVGSTLTKYLSYIHPSHFHIWLSVFLTVFILSVCLSSLYLQQSCLFAITCSLLVFMLSVYLFPIDLTSSGYPQPRLGYPHKVFSSRQSLSSACRCSCWISTQFIISHFVCLQTHPVDLTALCVCHVTWHMAYQL